VLFEFPYPGDFPRGTRLMFIQEAFYNGLLRKCGIKHQTLYFPDGHTGHTWGPASMRRNDLWTRSASGIDAKVLAVQIPLYLLLIS